MSHTFVTTSFNKPTFCDLCDKLLWGISKQGLSCQDCGFNVHRRCHSLVDSPCLGEDRPSTGGVVQSLLVQTAATSLQFARNRKVSNPPLNLMTTLPKNMSRFITRVGPLVTAHDFVIKILGWDDPFKTLIVLFGLSLICIYPAITLIVPQIVLIGYLFQTYYLKTKRVYVKPTAPSVQYLRNLQFIQNVMGLHSDIYDQVCESNKIFDWSDEIQTFRLLQLAFVSSIATLAISKYVPLNYLAFAGVWLLFCYHAPIVRAAIDLFIPPIHSFLKLEPGTLRQRIYSIGSLSRESSGSCSHCVGSESTIKLFENQRYWAGLGWRPQLLQAERSPWSDETGIVEYPEKRDFTTPGVGYEWVDRDWILNQDWAVCDFDGWVYYDNNWENSSDKYSETTVTRRRLWTRKTAKLETKLEPDS